METDKFRLRYLLSETALSHYLINLYSLYSSHSDILSSLSANSIEQLGKKLLDFLKYKEVIQNEKELISNDYEKMLGEKRKIIDQVVKAFFIINILKNNPSLLKNVSQCLSYVFKKHDIGSLETIVLNKTDKRSTRTWLGKTPEDLILASLELERIFMSKTTIQEAENLSPLLQKKTYSAIHGEDFDTIDSYLSLQNATAFTYFNRIRFKKNTIFHKSKLDIEKLHFLFKPLEDIELLSKSDQLNEFIVGFDGDLINYSLTPVKIINEKESSIQGCIDLTVEDGVKTRNIRYYDRNVDIPIIERNAFYILGLKNCWGFDTSFALFAKKISEQQFKGYIAFSYIASRYRLNRKEFDKLTNMIDIDSKEVIENLIFKNFIFQKGDMIYYVPQSIKDEIILLLAKNYNFEKPTGMQLVSKGLQLKDGKKVLKFFSINNDKGEFYRNGWNPNIILNYSLIDENNLYGPTKFGVWLNTLSINQIQRFLSHFGFKCIEKNNLILFKNNSDYSIYDIERDSFIIHNEKLENSLKVLRKNPLLCYAVEYVNEPKIDNINFNKLYESSILIYLFMERTECGLIRLDELIEKLVGFLKQDEDPIKSAIEKLKEEELLLSFEIESVKHLLLNPFKKIDFSIFIAHKDDFFYAKKAYDCIYKYNMPVILETNAEYSEPDRLRQIKQKYLKNHTADFINDYVIKVMRYG